MKFLTTIFFLFLFVSCEKITVREIYHYNFKIQIPEVEVVFAEEEDEEEEIELLDIHEYHDTLFVRLKDFSNDFVYDMKYASEDNFMNTKVYECSDCYLRAKTVKALLEANKDFMSMGYRIKIFDCYRPLDIQKIMWDLVPHTNYVANPKRGSIHNRGGAVDLTLLDSHGDELDMGTSFDHFGDEAHVDHQDLPEYVLNNRALLKEVMIKHHFRPMATEWWHYNLITASRDEISNFRWNCK